MRKRLAAAMLILPAAAAAVTYHIDCADSRWRSQEAVNAIPLQPGD
jgi:hypothetical protein